MIRPVIDALFPALIHTLNFCGIGCLVGSFVKDLLLSHSCRLEPQHGNITGKRKEKKFFQRVVVTSFEPSPIYKKSKGQPKKISSQFPKGLPCRTRPCWVVIRFDALSPTHHASSVQS